MTEHFNDQRRDRSTTRRRLLRGSAAAAGTVLAPTLAGRAAAADTITVNAAIPADTPKFGRPDYVGLVVQVGHRKGGDVDTSGLGSCSFVAQETAAEQGTYTAIDEDKIWAYNAEIVKRENAGGSGETTTLYSLAENTDIGPETRYIVNQQQQCGDYVQVQLEMLTEQGTGSETATPGGDGGGGGATETETPGFGVLAALGGIGAATAGALAMRGDGADDADE